MDIINHKSIKTMSTKELNLNSESLKTLITLERSQRGLTGRLEDLQRKSDMIRTAIAQRQIQGFQSIC